MSTKSDEDPPRERRFAPPLGRVNGDVKRHLVFLALTRAGLDELSEHFGRLPSPLWVNDGLLSKEELADLRAKGADVTSFSHRIAPGDTVAIESALAVIAEHHVGHHIWVERNGDV